MSDKFPAKRRKLNTERSISPPLIDQKGLGTRKHVTIPPTQEAHLPIPPTRSGPTRPFISNYLRSPVRLTKIKDLAPHQNVDAVELRDLLGDPLIEECWCFNFLFDVPFIMEHFDPDIRQHVKLKIIHGFWKNDDERRIDLLESASHYPNIDLISAYLPDPFGTHHTKMLILFRRDDAAQVIIHTANMIARDWRNMTQAVWESPLLPLQQAEEKPAPSTHGSHALGSGQRFKTDLMRYLDAYGKRLGALTKRLRGYDFSSIRAAFLGSAPSKQKPHLSKPALHTSFGWLGLREILSHVPVRADDGGKNGEPNIVIQVSSIATLGQTPTWLQHFQDVLSACRSGDDRTKDPSFNIIFPTPDEIRTSLDGYSSGGSIHTKIQSPAQQKQLEYLRPLLCHWRQPSPPPSSNNLPSAHRGPAAPHIKTYIRFSDQTRQSINWVMVTSANLSKQAWGDVVSKKTGEIRIQSWECGVVVWPELFKGEEEEMDAMMVPVFGKDEPGAGDEDGEEKGEVDQRVPEDDEDETESEAETETESRDKSTARQPNTNHGDETETEDDDETEDEDEAETEDENENEDRGEHQESESESDHQAKDKTAGGRKNKRIVGFRMPYDLPLTPFGADEVPWCASLAHSEPDWMGRTWQGY